jgi:hypothetical protein
MVGANDPRITCLDFELQLIRFFSFGSVGALFGITYPFTTEYQMSTPKDVR